MRRIQIVDLVRAFSILSVLAYHLALTGLANIQTLPSWALWIWQRVSYNGTLGVASFFVVSGYLITRLIAQQPAGLLRPNLKDFYVRRFGRIVPLLFAAILVGAIALALHSNPSAAFEACFRQKEAVLRASFWLSLATFTYNWYVTLFSAHPYVGLQWDILWSISIEEQFYLLYPLLLRKVSGKGELVRILFLLLFLGAIVRFINVWFYPTVLSYNSFQNFDLIALGCLLYLATEKWGAFLQKRIGWSLFICLSGLLLAGLIFFHFPTHPELWWALWNRQLFSIGIFLFLLGGFQISVFDWKLLTPLALPGKWSYGIYLLHVWVLYFLWERLQGQSLWFDFTLLTGAVCWVAWLSYRYFEMPVNAWIRSRLRSK